MDFGGKFQMRFLLKSARLAWLLACTDPASCWRHRHCLSRDCHRLSVFVSMVGLMMMLRIAWFSFLKKWMQHTFLRMMLTTSFRMETLLDFQDIVCSAWMDWNGKETPFTSIIAFVTETRLYPRVFQMNSVIHHQAVWPVVCEGKGIFAHLLYSH